MWTLYIPQVNEIVRYDCGSTHLNVTLSFLDVESNIPLTQSQIERSYILQLSKFEFIEVIQCKGSINRFIYYCGMHSHLLTVMNAQTEYILEITADQCKMHLTGIFSIDKYINKSIKYIYGLRVNQTTMRSTTFTGSANSDGRYSGAIF